MALARERAIANHGGPVHDDEVDPPGPSIGAIEVRRSVHGVCIEQLQVRPVAFPDQTPVGQLESRRREPRHLVNGLGEPQQVLRAAVVTEKPREGAEAAATPTDAGVAGAPEPSTIDPPWMTRSSSTSWPLQGTTRRAPPPTRRPEG